MSHRPCLRSCDGGGQEIPDDKGPIKSELSDSGDSMNAFDASFEELAVIETKEGEHKPSPCEATT